MRKKTIAFLLVAIVFTSCSMMNKTSRNKDQKDIKNDQNTQKFDYAFHEANKQLMLGKYNDAASFFIMCIELNNESAASYYQLANIAIRKEDYKAAMQFARAATKIDPKNSWYQLLLAALYQKNGFPQKSIDIYRDLVKASPENIELYYDLASAVALTGKSKDAIDIYNEIEQKIGISEEVILEKEKIYLLMGEAEKSQNELQKLINAFPDEPRYYGILAESYVSNKQFDKALETYNKLLEFDPKNGLAHFSLADYYRITKDFDKSFEHLKIAFSSSEVTVDIKVQMLVSFISVSASDPILKEQAYTLLNILLETHPNDPKAHTMYADYLVRDGEYKQAKEQLQLVVKTEKDKYLIWEQLLYVESELGEYQAMYDESKEALEYFPNQAMLYLFNGIASLELKKYNQSIESLKSGLDLTAKNVQLKNQFLIYLGDAYNRLQDHKNSDETFDKVLELDPENKFVLNNYSYYLSLRSEKLDKAAKMSKKCVDLDPENSTYLDTYAWVLYKKNEFNEAKKYMQKAIQNGGEKSAVIIEHYGDILYKLGEVDLALEQWKKAIGIGKGSEYLEKKVKEGKLFE